MKHFIIVGTQRTGSSALGEAMGTHPNVVCGWEWTQKTLPHKIPTVSESALLNNNYEILDNDNFMHMKEILEKKPLWIGYRRLFRSSSYWFINVEISPVHYIERLQWHLKWFKKNNFHIIHIVRRNNMSWLKSKALAKKTGNYSSGKYQDGITAYIDSKEALKRIYSKHWLDDKLSLLEKTNPYIRIYYEDFFKSNKIETEKVIEFLDEDSTLLPILEHSMVLKPQSSQSAGKLLENFQEVEDVLISHDVLTYT